MYLCLLPSASQLSLYHSLGPFHSSSPLWPCSPLQVLVGLCSHPRLPQLLVSELFLLAPACLRWSVSGLSSTPISLFHFRRCFRLYAGLVLHCFLLHHYVFWILWRVLRSCFLAASSDLLCKDDKKYFLFV